MSRRAFTLVELLVVITIIAILSAIAIVSLDSSRKQARNAKRIGDVKQLVTAFNLAFNAQGAYPEPAGSWHCISASCYGTWGSYYADTVYTDPFFMTYMTTKPTDPSNTPSDPAYDSRGQDGYVYNGTGGSGFPLGHLIAYTLETPATCGPGFLHATFPKYIRCVVNLDQY